jgi:tetratricopeptide (TPR) repeat protein
LMVSASDTTFVEDDQFIRNCLESDANNSAVLLVNARQALTKSRLKEAEELLRTVVAKQPDLVEAQARIGRILLDRGAEPEFLQWRRELQPDSANHPEIWHTQGLWARRNGQLPAAIRCFLEAAQLDPNHKGAVLQLSQLLKGTKYSTVADQLSERSQRLSQLHYLLMEVRFGYDSQLAKKIVELLDLLDRDFEAAGWCQILKLWSPNNHEWVEAKLKHLHRQIDMSGDLTGESGYLVAHIDPKEFPLPRWPQNGIARNEQVSTAAIDGDVQFVDVAAQVGVQFQYFNGTTSQQGLTHILQATYSPSHRRRLGGH